MRHRSLTNSRKTTDPDFRRAYGEEAGINEMLFYTGWRITAKGLERERPGVIEQPSDYRLFDCHHIGHRGAKRDWRTNLIFIPRESHDAIHFGVKGEPVYGVVICVYAKLLKADKTDWPGEFDLGLLNECFGQSVLAFCENAEVPPQIESLREECVERLAKLAMENQ